MQRRNSTSPMPDGKLLADGEDDFRADGTAPPAARGWPSSGVSRASAATSGARLP